MALRPQVLAVLGLLALPVALVFLVFSGEWVVAFAVVNTLLIVGSLYYMLSPVETTDHDHAGH